MQHTNLQKINSHCATNDLLSRSVKLLPDAQRWLTEQRKPVLIAEPLFIKLFRNDDDEFEVLRTTRTVSGIKKWQVPDDPNTKDFRRKALRVCYLYERAQRFRDCLSKEIGLGYQYSEYSLEPDETNSVELREIKSVLEARHDSCIEIESLLETRTLFRLAIEEDSNKSNNDDFLSLNEQIAKSAARLSQLPQPGTTFAQHTPMIGRQKIQLEQELLRAKLSTVEAFEEFIASVSENGYGVIESLTIESLLDFYIYVAVLQGADRWQMPRIPLIQVVTPHLDLKHLPFCK